MIPFEIERTMQRFLISILVISAAMIPIIVVVNYLSASWVNTNTHEEFKTRAEEHLRQEQLSIQYHTGLIENDKTIYAKIDSIEKRLDKLEDNLTNNNVTVR
jgi:hypothetical protein